MGQCLFKCKTKNKSKKKVVDGNTGCVMTQSQDSFVIEPIKTTSVNLKLLNQVKYDDDMSSPSSSCLDFDKHDTLNPFNEFYELAQHVAQSCSIHENKVESKEETPIEEIRNAESIVDDDEQSIVLVNTDNANLVNELLFGDNQIVDIKKRLERIEEIIKAEENNQQHGEPQEEAAAEVPIKNKTECKYQKVLHEGLHEDLELLNKCVDVKKPTLFFYKAMHKNEKQLANKTSNLLFKEQLKLSNDKRPRLNQKQMQHKVLLEKRQKLKLRTKDNKPETDLKVIETIEKLNFHKKSQQKDYGDHAKPIETPTLGDILAKSKPTLGLKSKTLGRKSKNYITSILDSKKDNIYQYPVNLNFRNNLNRNDSGNIAIDDEDRVLQVLECDKEDIF